MYYLRRINSQDIEGPYSIDYLRQMAKDGKLDGSDNLLNAETNEELTVSQLIDVPTSAQPNQAPPTATPPKATHKVTPAQGAIIGLIIVASLCILPLLLMIPTASKILIQSTDMLEARDVLNQVRRATEAYCNDYDGFFPSGMGNRDEWTQQLSPYLPADVSLEFPNGDMVEANKNLDNLRMSSVIDPGQTVMFYVMPQEGTGEYAAVANVYGQVGLVPAKKMQKSIDSGIFNVPIER
ncbi:MAG: hypothetical protein KF836_03985 [Fimbriimonadaceae bacterium]|nr:hypothetical protein [Fimbriimonadaceae bacterium]